MLQSGSDCASVLTQLAAMKSALTRVGMKLLGCDLGREMARETRAGGTGQATLDDALTTFMRL